MARFQNFSYFCTVFSRRPHYSEHVYHLAAARETHHFLTTTKLQTNYLAFMSKVDLALEIAVKAHAGALDRDGEAYILHPLAVGLMGKTDEERMTGFLHDVLEDSDCTPE